MDRYIKAFPQLLMAEASAEAHLSTVSHHDHARYVPKSIVGYGAYATVLKIERVGSGELSCLKVMESHDEHQHRNALHMLTREARLTNASSSFATMRIHSIYEGLHLSPEVLRTMAPPTTPTAAAALNENKGSFFCGCLMEYFEGGTMNQEISARRRKRLPLGEAQAGFLFLQVALALAEAHRNGVMHRDVKPSNIFMRASGLVCLADFGLASDNPRSTTLCGTPFYIAPEMWLGQPYDSKVDVWSLGVVLYELLTFARPFVPADPTARTNDDIKAVILSGQAPPPLPDTISEPFRALVADLLTPDPAARPTCEQVLQYPLCKALTVLFLRAVRVQAVGAVLEGQIVGLCLRFIRSPKTPLGSSHTHSSAGLSTSNSDAALMTRPRPTQHRTATSVTFGPWYRTTVTLDTAGESIVITADDTANETLSFEMKDIAAAFPSSYPTLTGNHEGIVVLVSTAGLTLRVQFVSIEEAQNFAATVDRITAAH